MLQDGACRDLALHDHRAEIRAFEQFREGLAFGVDLDIVGFEMTTQPRRLIRTFDDHQRAALAAANLLEFGRQRLE